MWAVGEGKTGAQTVVRRAPDTPAPRRDLALRAASFTTVVMSTLQDSLDKLMSDLNQQRDELEVQLHLAKAEARDEWEEIEKRWEKVKSKVERASGEATDIADDVGDAAKLLLEEIGKGYQRLRKLV
jgi:archaellum component FlaC